MVLLALETVTRPGSLALWDNGVCHLHEGDATRTHVERLPAEMTTLLAAHGRELRDLDLVAVVSGPGSFTGLRVGLAAVQGLALARGLPVVGIPTLEALATTWTHTSPSSDEIVAACLDGMRGEVFVAAFDPHGAPLIGRHDEVLSAMVSKPEEAADRLAEVAGTRPLVIVGGGARRYAGVFAARLPAARLVDAPVVLADAAARLAADRFTTAVAPHALRPIYVRRPDAVLARERAALEARRLKFSIRRASSGDLAAVEALQRATFTNPWGAESIRWELEQTDVARLYVMREPAGTLVAYCACWMIFDELHINSLAVDPNWRRRGLARELLRQVFTEARASGARSATLEVRSSNQPARALYEGLGFRVEAVRRDYYQEPREDALVLWNRQLA